ncbi:hypothetical protein CEXT_402431 [Caerostris extrusa]|uniref:Uncharacterized protein n=1 Tax=Caerostris extrusa TaxID=172846 RepID=A0AAV4PHY2_CAEEX|nr:hypothetical protein CEXT_402431 [Caerostris extrusa]
MWNITIPRTKESSVTNHRQDNAVNYTLRNAVTTEPLLPNGILSLENSHEYRIKKQKSKVFTRYLFSSSIERESYPRLRMGSPDPHFFRLNPLNPPFRHSKCHPGRKTQSVGQKRGLLLREVD